VAAPRRSRSLYAAQNRALASGSERTRWPVSAATAIATARGHAEGAGLAEAAHGCAALDDADVDAQHPVGRQHGVRLARTRRARRPRCRGRCRSGTGRSWPPRTPRRRAAASA
jgi:hypothetical protein